MKILIVILLLLLLLICGCSTTYRPHIIEHRDSILLFDCATPAQPEKLAKMLMEKLK
jgi:hypothetical protein